MAAELEFREVPEGPPPSRRGYASKWTPLYVWLDSHVGQWAMVENINAGVGTRLRSLGYETQVNKRDDGRFDVYVRRPE